MRISTRIFGEFAHDELGAVLKALTHHSNVRGIAKMQTKRSVLLLATACPQSATSGG
jgi:hypothetical protein